MYFISLKREKLSIKISIPKRNTFKWGFIKHQIWSQPPNLQPQNIRALKLAIQNAASNLNPLMIQRAFTRMVHRINNCIEANGHAFADE